MTVLITPAVSRRLSRGTIPKTQLVPPRRRGIAQRLGVFGVLSVVLVGLAAAPAWSAVGAEQRGAALLAQVQSGQTSCAKLSAGDLASIGEYSMGRLMGSAAAQDAMNAQMLAATGARGELLAYRFMGARLGGCATGSGPVAFGTMMGMMGTSMMGASYGSAYPAGGHGSSMMGGGYGSSQTAGNGGTSGGVIVAIVLGALVLLALMILLVTRRAPPRRTQPRAA